MSQVESANKRKKKFHELKVGLDPEIKYKDKGADLKSADVENIVYMLAVIFGLIDLSEEEE